MVKLRIVTYNVRSLRDDRAAVVRTLRELDADVACIQEAPRFFRWRSKCAALARESGLLYVAGGGSACGTAMLAAQRVDISGAIAYRLSRTPRLHHRGVVAARVHKAGAWCTVVSVHLGLDAAERARHRRELLGLVERYREPATILAGDFNETADGPTWRALATEFADSGADDGVATFTAQNPRHGIDAVLVRGPVTVLSHEVIDSPDVRIGSDHRPVVVEVELPAGPG